MSAPVLPLWHVRRVYGDMTAAVDASTSAFPCRKGCAGCCHLPIHCYDRDLDMIREAVAALPEAERDAVFDRASGYVERLRLLGANVDDPRGYPVLRTQGRGVLLPVFAEFWPPGGIACPLLVPGETTRATPEAAPILHGTCAVYGSRPADCRLHFSHGPEKCVPPGAGSNMLAVGGARSQLERALHLRPAGLLGIEVWRMLRVAVN